MKLKDSSRRSEPTESTFWETSGGAEPLSAIRSNTILSEKPEREADEISAMLSRVRVRFRQHYRQNRAKVNIATDPAKRWYCGNTNTVDGLAEGEK